MSTEPTPALLLQMIQQNDEKHCEGHDRLRQDFTEGFSLMNANLDKLSAIVSKDHDIIISLSERGMYHKEMSMNRAVITAAMIGGGVQVLVMVLGWMDTLLKQLL